MSGWGAVPDGEGTRFRLWAPGVQSLSLELETGEMFDMAPADEGWFEAKADVGPGCAYRFKLPDGRTVPDPASRRQKSDVHGWSLVVEPSAYSWENAWKGRPWTEAVIYEAHCGVLGGYSGLSGRLADLAKLGFTAIELMPLAAVSGTRNWGYDGVLPYAASNAYGSLEELKDLIDKAHGLGLMVLLDVVYNHFGPDGNYLPIYAPDFFHHERNTPWGGAIAFDREPVARFFIDNARYWIEEFRFDGLRLDAVHAIADNGFLDRLACELRQAVPDRQLHLILENETNDPDRLERGYDAQWNDDFHNVLHVLLTGETHGYYAAFADKPEERLARCLSEGFIYQGEAMHGGRARGAPSAHLPPTAFVAFLQNHDQVGNRALGERLTRLVAPDRLMATTGLLLLCPQIPLVFMGDEVGSDDPFLFFTDFHDELADAVREGRRREFSGFPGFDDAQAREAIPDPNALTTFDASRPHPGARAETWLGLYEDLLKLRVQHLTPWLEVARPQGATVLGDGAVIASWSLGRGGRLTLALNIGSNPVALPRLMGAPLKTIGAVSSDGLLDPSSFAAWAEPQP